MNELEGENFDQYEDFSELAHDEIADSSVRLLEEETTALTKEGERFFRGEFLNFRIKGEIHKIAVTEGDALLANITVYNPTKPIVEGESEVLFGRKESLEFENDSEMVVFRYNRESNIWEMDEEGPVFKDVQDPFYCGSFYERDEHGENHAFRIIGGVKIDKDDAGKITNWKTVFYKYENSISELKGAEPFMKGPDGMKDIRLTQLQDGSIGVFTRPRNENGFGGLGTIGYINIQKISDLESSLKEYVEQKDESTLISDLYKKGEWGGANELHVLNGGLIGVLCHVARKGPDDKKYYEAAAFIFDPKSRKHTQLEILTTADDFEPISPKSKEMGKIIFSGGLVRNSNGIATLYVGVGDVKAGKIIISDPFAKYEYLTELPQVETYGAEYSMAA